MLSSGEILTADVVVCNADLVYAYNNLLPPSTSAKSLSRRPASCSSISFYWSLSRSIPKLTAHNIFLADEFRESFDSIFKQHFIPKSPSFYVNVPSRIDPTAAPHGKDAIVVLVPVGHLISSDSPKHKGTASSGSNSDVKSPQDWTTMIALARRTVISTIAARTGVDLTPLIIHESVNTPQTWQSTFNLDKGAILGLSHSFFNVLSFRPKTKHPEIKGLYFVGASTHPGTGVPICLAGSKIVAEQILEDLGIGVPWNQGGLDGVGVKERAGIDQMHLPPLLSWFHVGILVLVLSGLIIWIGGGRSWDWSLWNFGGKDW